MKHCSVAGCEHKHIAKGMCTLHYQRARAGRPLDGPSVERRRASDPELPCRRSGCDAPRHGRGMCQKHYDMSTKNECPGCGDRKGKRAALCWPCRSALKGPNSPAWKGGRSVLPEGYVRVYAPEDDRANLGRYMLEHKLVMETHMGRRLRPGENVHHKNGVRHDNRIENLELWVISQPQGQRAVDLVAWAHEIIEMYGGIK